ncbi:MAG: hypothetical protein ACI4I6_02615 [Hominimerdicola sp.]
MAKKNFENFVVSGDYAGKEVLYSEALVYINISFFKSGKVNKMFAENYEVKEVLGNGKYHILVNFKDGKSSLLEVTEDVKRVIEKHMN